MLREEKLLIVDDDFEIRSLLIELLKTQFKNLEVCENGEEACKKLKSNNYDLVLTDIMMPVVDGMGVLKEAKALDNDIIVLMITGKASLKSAIDSVNLGADGYITKPFDLRSLLVQIVSHLERQRLQRENVKLQKQIEKDRDKLNKNLVELSILYNFSRNLTFNFDVSEVYHILLESLSEAVENDCCSIFSIKNKKMIVRTSVELTDETVRWLKKSVLDFALSHCEDCTQEDEIVVEILQNEEPVATKGNVRSTFNFFLKTDETHFGVLNVNRFSGEDFSENDKEFLAKLAEQCGTAFTQLRKVVESQKSKIERMIKDMPDGIIMHDQQADSILLNPAARTMLAGSDINDHDRNSLESLFGVKFDDLYKKTQNNGNTTIHELKIAGKGENNGDLIFDAHIACISGPDSLPQGILMVLRDVTRERELDRLKSEFISNVSHELRTPAAVLKEFTSIIRDEIAGPTTEAQDDYLQIMSNNIDRLLRLIDNLLNMSLVEANKLKLKKTKFDPTFVLKNVI